MYDTSMHAQCIQSKNGTKNIKAPKRTNKGPVAVASSLFACPGVGVGHDSFLGAPGPAFGCIVSFWTPQPCSLPNTVQLGDDDWGVAILGSVVAGYGWEAWSKRWIYETLGYC